MVSTAPRSLLVGLAVSLSLEAAGCVRAGGLFGERDGRAQDLSREAAEAQGPRPDFAVLSIDGPPVAVVGAGTRYLGLAINLGSGGGRGFFHASIMNMQGSGAGGTGSSSTSGVVAAPGVRFSIGQIVPPTAVLGTWLARFCAEVEGDADPTNDCRDLSFDVVGP